MKKLFLLLSLLCSINFLTAQDIIYTITAELNKKPVQLDSILFENLTTGTKLLFDDLPEQMEYTVNLTNQEIVTSLRQFETDKTDGCSLVKNLPGEIGISGFGEIKGQIELSVYNINGQKIYQHSLAGNTNRNNLTLYLPQVQVYIVSLQSKDYKESFQAVGSEKNQNFAINFDESSHPKTLKITNPPMKNTTDFSFQVGDNLKISTFVEDYYSKAIEFVVGGSESFHFCHKDKERIYVEGDKFYVYNGKEIFINGVNTPWDNWNDFGSELSVQGYEYNRSFWNNEFQRIKAHGGNSTRIWITCDGEVGFTYSEDGKTVKGATAKHWQNLEDLFELARQNQIYINATLISFNHTQEDEDNEYHLNFDRWRGIMSDTALVNRYIENYLDPFLQKFKDNPYLWSIDACNEIEWMNFEEKCGLIDWPYLQYFVASVAAKVHKESYTLVTMGSASVRWNSDQSGHDGNYWRDDRLGEQRENYGDKENAYLDFYSPHYYPGTVRYFGNFAEDKTPESYGISDKPCIVGENPARGIYLEINDDKEVVLETSMDEAYVKTNNNGWCGLMAWTSNGKEDPSSDFIMGSLDDCKIGLSTFYYQYPEKVFPLGVINILPSVKTESVVEITENSATINFNVLYDGGATVTERGVKWYASDNPETGYTKLVSGSGTGDFTTTITDLEPGTTYNVRAYAINSVGMDLGYELSFTTLSGLETSTVTDYDGNTYQTIKIGEQWWMAENLKVTNYSDGTQIPLITNNTEWGDLVDNNTDRAYCYYNNNANNETETYGALYTWAAAMNGNESSSNNPSGVQGVCPTGWHLPSDDEWKELEIYLGMSQTEADEIDWRGTDEGGKLKEIGITNWTSPNTGATNESGFTARPGGTRHEGDGLFYGINSWGEWWTSTEESGINAWARYPYYNNSKIFRSISNKSHGFSVRCIKNESTTSSLPELTTTPISDITETTATCGGNITDDGGSAVTERGVCWSTSTNTTITDNSTSDGSGAGTFISSISGLTANTTYYVRAYATNSVGTAYGDEVNFTTNDEAGTGTVTDYDGNTYQTVIIGNQEWMAENLQVTHYYDGTEIPLVMDNTEWANLGDNNTDRAYCYYNNNTNGEAETYGALYTWAAAMNGENSSIINPSGVQGICPTGWHLPSDAEWKELEMYLGITPSEVDNEGYRGTNEGSNLAGNASLWNNGILESNAEFGKSGFAALPGGGRGYGIDGIASTLGDAANFWSATERYQDSPWSRLIKYNNTAVFRYGYLKSNGFSVRCLKD